MVCGIVAVSCGRNHEAVKREYVRAGDVYVAQGRHLDAIIEYRRAIVLDPRFGEARAKLGRTYLLVNDAPQALREYVRAADLLPDDLDVQLSAGRLLHLAGHFEDAKSRAQRVLQKESRNVDAQVLLGSALAGLKDLDGAIGKLEDAVTIEPNHGRLYSAIGGFKLSQGRNEEAETAFRRAIALDPTASRSHIALGYYLWAVRRIPEAEDVFKHALELDPKSALVNRILATLLLTTGRVAQAEPYLKTLAETGPTSRLTQIGRAHV